MLHNGGEGDTRSILQVELNTIASSFACLSSRIANMHQLLFPKALIPLNPSIDSLSRGIILGYREYLGQCKSESSPIVIFIVQPAERNFSDQRILEFELLRRERISVIRATLNDIASRGFTDLGTGALFYEGMEVALVYFRAGYTPDDYPNATAWEARRLIEFSKAIKCPDIAYHLVGTKKVQQVLAAPGELERFIPAEDCIQMRKVFAGLYNLDVTEARAGQTK